MYSLTHENSGLYHCHYRPRRQQVAGRPTSPTQPLSVPLERERSEDALHAPQVLETLKEIQHDIYRYQRPRRHI